MDDEQSLLMAFLDLTLENTQLGAALVDAAQMLKEDIAVMEALIKALTAEMTLTTELSLRDEDESSVQRGIQEIIDAALASAQEKS